MLNGDTTETNLGGNKFNVNIATSMVFPIYILYWNQNMFGFTHRNF